MTRRALGLAAPAACLVLAALAASDAGASRGGHQPAPARILVYAQEWSLWPSRSSLPGGKVIVQLWNRGEDAHDLRVRRLRHGHMTGRAQRVRITQSGALHEATWKLGRGTYELYCSLPGHLHRGMHVKLVVR
jgi:hypothetical protein